MAILFHKWKDYSSLEITTTYDFSIQSPNTFLYKIFSIFNTVFNSAAVNILICFENDISSILSYQRNKFCGVPMNPQFSKKFIHESTAKTVFQIEEQQARVINASEKEEINQFMFYS